MYISFLKTTNLVVIYALLIIKKSLFQTQQVNLVSSESGAY
jgi:hypothetical protein